MLCNSKGSREVKKRIRKVYLHSFTSHYPEAWETEIGRMDKQVSVTYSDSLANACSHQWQHHAQSDCTCPSFLAPALHAYTRFLGSSVKTRALLHPSPNELT